MPPEPILAIDVGTGSVRAALVAHDGAILHIAAREHEQIVPAFGWSEQRPADWWAGVVHVVRAVLAAVPDVASRVAAVCACGQMHGTVLVDADGVPTRETVPLWNDKRTAPQVAAFERAYPAEAYLRDAGNPATPAWPGFKLQWLRDHDPAAYAATATVLMPKDYVNFRLTGERATDITEGSASFLMDPGSGRWSAAMLERLGLDARILPPIRLPAEILGAVTPEAAAETGLRAGLPVLVGGGDYPVALLGSGAAAPGVASDVTGTSAIVTLLSPAPVLHPEVSNVAVDTGLWGSFVLLDSGGDAMRWARRALHDNAMSYAAIVARAAEAPAGADALFFLPYLSGERFGAHRNARAQFFGLAAGHGMPHLHRAVMEGVAFACARHLRAMQHAAGARIERLVASGGGAKTELWLRIKASAYGIPVLVPREAECGVVGCAALAATALGRFPRLDAAVAHMARIAAEIAPDPAWADRYAAMMPVFDRLYEASQPFYDALDTLR